MSPRTLLVLALALAGVTVAPVPAAAADTQSISGYETITHRRDALSELAFNLGKLGKQAPPAELTVAQQKQWQAQSQWFLGAAQQLQANVNAHNEVLSKLATGKLGKRKSQRLRNRLTEQFNEVLGQVQKEQDFHFSAEKCGITIGWCSRGDSAKTALMEING